MEKAVVTPAQGSRNVMSTSLSAHYVYFCCMTNCDVIMQVKNKRSIVAGF